MAKITFTKLGLVKNTDVKTVEWKDQIIEVKQYLPIQEKLSLIAAVVNQSQDENNFVNDAKVKLFTVLEIMYYYTNISFTDKQKEDPVKLYDLLVGSKFIDKIYAAMPENEVDQIFNLVYSTAEHFYKYRNSVYGILDAVKNDYDLSNLDLKGFIEQIKGSGELGLIQEIAPLLNS